MNLFGYKAALPKGLSRWVAAAAVGVPMLWSAGAHAVPIITISLQEAGFNGGNVTQVATDNGSGAAVFSGQYGTYTFNTVTAQGVIAIPTPGYLSSTSINTSSSGGTIAVYVTQSGLTSPTGLTNFLSTFTANQPVGVVTVVESTFINNTQMATATFNGIGTAVSTNATSLSGTYSETTKYLISISGVGSVNDTITLSASPVPEPMSLALLGTGLVGLGLIRRRSSTAA